MNFSPNSTEEVSLDETTVGIVVAFQRLAGWVTVVVNVRSAESRRIRDSNFLFTDERMMATISLQAAISRRREWQLNVECALTVLSVITES